MKAWQFTKTHEPLVLAEVDEPTAAPGEVVVDIKAAGLCHSDVGLLEDESFPLAPGAQVPLTLGHEVAGVISEVGADVAEWRVGDRVGIALVGDRVPGLGRDGGYSFRLTAPPEALVRIPDGVPFEQAAAGTDAGVTAYHAVVAAGQVVAGTKVGIIGLGGLGQIGARIAVLQGAEVYAAEVKEDVWGLGDQIGVKRVAADISAFADEQLDVIVDFAGFGTTTAAAIETVRPDGRVVQVGMGRLQATISTQALIMRQITLVGVLGGTKDDLRGVYEVLATGRLDPAITTIAFDEIPDGLRRLSEGTVVGRLVAKIAD
ncbi:zinc-binding dehydrogenase [Microbacterium betulae]|uniref:alcohol dehydrogenase n=1 Tax=Microbacterium betulae TaxID=2981139 RepID=A0AA97FIC4_9MICO|nr:zinc-binding dehydrogenase [Microbacterium sp. AB]WOF22835.1 zinc-binding dehydrogenase [Microbacterium sp. AB]